MSGDTWVALDGRDPATFTGTCWISDCGLYTGPNPAVMFTDTTLVPVDAKEVDYLIVLPNPDGHDNHVLESGYTTADYEQWYLADGELSEHGSPSALDSGAHLFVVWYAPGVAPGADPATLPTPVDSPLDLAPAGWVAGARRTPFVLDTDIPAIGLFDEGGTALLRYFPLASGITYQHELSAPGALSCRLPMDDAATAAATPKRILKVFYRGAARMAARIDSSSVEVAVDGRAWREFNNLPGVLSMLDDARIFPEYGIARSTQGTRVFGYMSKDGAWTSSGNWTAGVGYTYNSDVTNKKGWPQGLDFPNPYWIAKTSPTHVEADGAVQYFRKTFTTSSGKFPYQELATADDWLTLWLDGEMLYQSDQQTAKEWRGLQQITGDLPDGDHVLAARVVNANGYVDNPIAFIMTLQKLLADGTVDTGSPIVNSDTSWDVADNHPGFTRADVLATIWAEAAGRSVQAMSVLSLGFSHTTDSASVAWADDPNEYELDVMSSLLDAVDTLTQKDLDVDVNFDTLTVNAYNDLGSDLSGSVALTVGGSIIAHRVDRVEAKFNTALVQKSDGTYDEIQDASVSEYGRMETGLQLGSTADQQTASDVATGAFASNAHTIYTFTTQISPLAGPQPYVDFNLGDSITVPNDLGVGVKARVLSLTVDFTGEVPKLTPELVSDPS